MFRLLERNPVSPKNSRHPARATANEAALIKRDGPVGESAVGTVETTTVHTLFGRPVTSAEQRNATPFGVAFSAFGEFTGADRRFRGQSDRKWTCQPGCFAVVSELPIKRLTRATRMRAEQARRQARKLRRPDQSLPGCTRRKLP